MNQELITQNDTQIQRIDLDNPASIYLYGSEVLDDYQQLKENIPASLTNSPVREYEFSDPIRIIEEFNKSLSGEEPSRTKATLKKSKLANGICTAINKINRGNVDLLSVNDHSVEEYTAYLDAIRDTAENMLKEKIALDGDTRELTEFKIYVSAVHQKLGETIEQGYTDIERFEAEIEPLKMSNPDEYMSKKMLIDLAKERLLSLKTSETLMKGVISQIDLANALAIEQHIKFDEFLQVTAPTVSVFSRLAVRIKQDQKRLERLREVRSVVNGTITSAADRLTNNIEGTIELNNNSLITRETLLHTAKQFKLGTDMLARYQSEKSQHYDGVMSALSDIDSLLDSCMPALVKAQISGEIEPETQKIKRLGSL